MKRIDATYGVCSNIETKFTEVSKYEYIVVWEFKNEKNVEK